MSVKLGSNMDRSEYLLMHYNAEWSAERNICQYKQEVIVLMVKDKWFCPRFMLNRFNVPNTKLI